jgi:hypothetical protein
MANQKSELQLVTNILEQLKGHPNFVIANRIVDELSRLDEQKLSPRPKIVIKK